MSMPAIASAAGIKMSGCLSICSVLTTANHLDKIPQTWHKHAMGLEDKLICQSSRVEVTATR